MLPAFGDGIVSDGTGRERKAAFMTDVSINGYKLHEVEMLLTSYSENTVSYLKYPEHRIQSKFEGDELRLKIPAFLVLELYRRAVLPQNQVDSVSIQISGKKMGEFVVIDFRYPHNLAQDRDMVSITLQRVGQANVQT